MFLRVFRFLSFFILGIVIFFFFLFLGLKQILDRQSVKDIAVDTIRKYVQLDLSYSEIKSIVFPLPGLQIRDLKVKDGNEEIVSLSSLEVYLSVVSLLKSELKLNSLLAEKGTLYLLRDRNGSFPILTKLRSLSKDDKKEEEEIKEEGPKALLSLIPENLTVNDFSVFLTEEQTESTHILQIQNADLSVDAGDLSASFHTKVKLNEKDLYADVYLHLEKNEWNLNSLYFNSSFGFNELELGKYQDLVGIFENADLTNAKVSGDIQVQRKKEGGFELQLSRLLLSDAKNSRHTELGELSFASELNYDPQKKLAELKRLDIALGNYAKLDLSGSFSQEENHNLQLLLKSEFIDLKKVLALQNSFSKINPSRSKIISSYLKHKPASSPPEKKEEIQIPLTAKLSLDVKNFNADGYVFSYVKGDVNYGNQEVLFPEISAGIYGGEIRVNGNLKLASRYPELNAKLNLSSINLEPALLKAADQKLIKGRLNSNLTLSMFVGSKEMIQNSLRLKGNFFVRNGALQGYANFIKPIAEIGKLLNFNGSSGDSTSFESISGKIEMQNQKLTLSEFDMKGVGLSAVGGGTYQANGKIDMKFTVALPGLAGKAVKLPILYKGVFGRNFAYIDPIWLASVYAGTVLLAGPVGAVVGGLAGSTVSDTVEKTIGTVEDSVESVKDFFLGKKDPKKK